MATVTAALVPDPNGWISRYKWTPLLNTDVGSAVNSAYFADRSVQVFGTFGGGTIVLQGSNDGGTTYVTLKDPLGNNLSFTTAGFKMIGDLAHLIRPSVSGGDGTTSLSVWVLMRGNQG